MTASRLYGTAVWLVLTLGVVLLATLGCSSIPVVKVPVTDLALAYADAKAEVAVSAALLTEACRQRRLTPELCDRLGQSLAKAKALETQVRAALANPTRPIDPALVRQYLSEAAGWLGTVAGLVGRGAIP